MKKLVSVVIQFSEEEVNEDDMIKEIKKLLIEKYEKKAYVKSVFFKNKGE